MPFTAYGNPSSPTYSTPIADIYPMLNVLPDNTGNEISARNVRDVVTGLWENMKLIQASFSTPSPPFVFNYNNSNPTTVVVGGVSTQSTFSNNTLEQMFERMFYPYTPPILSLSVIPSLLEFGNTLSTVVLTWSFSSTKNPVVNAVISSPSSNQNVNNGLNAFLTISGVLGSNAVLPNVPTIFTFSVDDTNVNVLPNTGTVHTISATVDWSLKRFWGTLPASSPLMSVSTAPFNFSDVSGLNFDLLNGYTQSRNITTNNDYTVFIWPTNSADLTAIPPVMFVNGLPNTDWTRTRTGVIFTNQFGYTASYDVWRFNSLQPSYTLNYNLL